MWVQNKKYETHVETNQNEWEQEKIKQNPGYFKTGYWTDIIRNIK